MTDEMDALWLRMLPLLEAISNKVSRSQPSHLKEIGRSDNETYLMRAYLAFKKQNGGSEVAVTVDIRRQGNLFKIDADICTDEGKLVVPTQVYEVLAKEVIGNPEPWKDGWLNDFEHWLFNQEAVLISAVSELT